jgi:hypothetical protein
VHAGRPDYEARYDGACGGGEKDTSELEKRNHERTQRRPHCPGNRPCRTHHHDAPLGRFLSDLIEVPFRYGKQLRKGGGASAKRQAKKVPPLVR